LTVNFEHLIIEFDDLRRLNEVSITSAVKFEALFKSFFF